MNHNLQFTMSQIPFTIKEGCFYRLYTESTDVEKHHADFIIEVSNINGTFITATILTMPPHENALNVRLNKKSGSPGKPDELTILFSESDCYFLKTSEKAKAGEKLQLREIPSGQGLVYSDITEKSDDLTERKERLQAEIEKIKDDLQRLSTHKSRILESD